jgi:nonribosomal peptide synthetase protein BlmVI
MRRFTEAFGPCGFPATAHFPCYGLAEATLLVTDPGKHRSPRLLRADAGGLRSGQAGPAAGGAPAVSLVSAGRPAIGTDVRIVEPATAQPLAEGRVGEVWVAGASIARGYWNCGPDPAGAFGQRLPGAPGQHFLRTGDLGFLLGGELYLTGRLKDVIVVRGENHYPQDLEWAAQIACPRLRPAAVAAFLPRPARRGRDRLPAARAAAARARNRTARLGRAAARRCAEDHQRQDPPASLPAGVPGRHPAGP